jgi:metallo-beta-lactamase class B
MLTKTVRYFTVLLGLFANFIMVLQANEILMPSAVPSTKSWANNCSDWDKWDKPGPAFRIFANSYYVGTCGIAAILITSDTGHILIDGATDAGADVIAENIQKLGFSLQDVKLLLHSHEHFDHVAGLAKLQKLTGAKLLASEQAAPVFETGEITHHDPQAGTHQPFPPAKVNAIVYDNKPIRLGSLTLTPIATPGHTYGSLSWQWKSCDNNVCYSVVYADSLSPVSNSHYQFSDHPEYVDAYQQGLAKLAKLDCQILLTPHPSASNMRNRLMQPQGLFDSKGCWNYSDKVSKRLGKRLAKEQQNSKAAP